jgi:hypothetical protein
MVYNMSILQAKDIAKETAKLNSSFSQVMNLAIQLKEENDALKRQRDEALGKHPLFEKNQSEANKLNAKDLKPALILALSQRDIAMRSVEKIHVITGLIDDWDSNSSLQIRSAHHAEWTDDPSAFDIVRFIKDVILSAKEKA